MRREIFNEVIAQILLQIGPTARNAPAAAFARADAAFEKLTRTHIDQPKRVKTIVTGKPPRRVSTDSPTASIVLHRQNANRVRAVRFGEGGGLRVRRTRGRAARVRESDQLRLGQRSDRADGYLVNFVRTFPHVAFLRRKRHDQVHLCWAGLLLVPNGARIDASAQQRRSTSTASQCKHVKHHERDPRFDQTLQRLDMAPRNERGANDWNEQCADERGAAR